MPSPGAPTPATLRFSLYRDPVEPLAEAGLVIAVSHSQPCEALDGPDVTGVDLERRRVRGERRACLPRVGSVSSLL